MSVLSENDLATHNKGAILARRHDYNVVVSIALKVPRDV